MHITTTTAALMHHGCMCCCAIVAHLVHACCVCVYVRACFFGVCVCVYEINVYISMSDLAETKCAQRVMTLSCAYECVHRVCA